MENQTNYELTPLKHQFTTHFLGNTDINTVPFYAKINYRDKFQFISLMLLY